MADEVGRSAGSVGGILRAHRARIAATYGLTLVENLLELLYPLATGLAIDGLLAGRRWSLAPLVGTWAVHGAVSVARHAYDARLFSRVYAAVAALTVTRQRAAGVPSTEVAARAAMAREVVDFVEREVPVAARTVVGLAGAVAMLALYDPWLGLVAAGLLAPAYAINRRYGRRALALNRGLNDEVEREVAVVEAASADAVAAHFRAIGRWRVRLSDAELKSWSLGEACSVAAVVAALLRATSLPGVEPGAIYAILAYVWTMLERLDEAPRLVVQAGRLVDIRRRLEEDGWSSSS